MDARNPACSAVALRMESRMISDSDADKIEHAIATKASGDAQWAIAYGLVKCSRALFAISSTAGFEGMMATRHAGEKIADAIMAVSSSLSEMSRRDDY